MPEVCQSQLNMPEKIQLFFVFYFLYSCQSTKLTSSLCAQIRLYFPQLGHSGFGIIRALVRDSYDRGSGPSTRTFLDSDGLIGQIVRNQTTPELDSGAALLQVKVFRTRGSSSMFPHNCIFASTSSGIFDDTFILLDFCRFYTNLGILR